MQNGRFPADEGVGKGVDGKEVSGAGWIETEVRTKNPLEFLQTYLPVCAVLLVMNVVMKVWRILLVTVGVGR